jgi:hypothetical protein
MKGAFIFMLIFFSIYVLKVSGEDLVEEENKQQDEKQKIFFEKEEDIRPEEDTGWAWGDIIFIDLENAKFKIRYFNYEKEIEEEIFIFVDEHTVFENVKDLSQIKLQDSVSVDYIKTSKGNIARLITVERYTQGLKN